MAKKHPQKQVKISKIEVTREKISGRGGLFFIVRYIENTHFFTLFFNIFGHLKKSNKGLSCYQFIKQILAYFIDGSNMSITGFDRRKQNSSYAALLESQPEDMASSHQIKRFFRKLGKCPQRLYRRVLLELFIWRLNIEQPAIIELFIDSKVYDNHMALCREGVEPTYKKKMVFILCTFVVDVTLSMPFFVLVVCMEIMAMNSSGRLVV